MPQTLYDKLWNLHEVIQREDGTHLLYIDRHLIHEVTSPQAFDGINSRKINVFRPDRTIATADHNVPTENQHLPIQEKLSRNQVEMLTANCKEHNIKLYGLGHKYQGIVHVIGPELGLTQPGMTIVCGDSHTSTHGAFGSIAFGIGTSEVEHVLATQTLIQKPAKNMRILVNGQLKTGVTAKDIILHIIGQIGTAGGTGYVIEYAGEAISNLSMEGRMTICNMSIEAGARAGLIAPDDITFEYIRGRPYAPTGDNWDKAVKFWKSLPSDHGANYDKEIIINADDIAPQITWGTSPQDVVAIDGTVPNPNEESNPNRKKAMERSLEYMGLEPQQEIQKIKIDKVFIGSCTNGRIEDLREVAKIMEGKKVKEGIRAMIVPGSGLVREQAEEEGIAQKLKEAGFEWRLAGCSMCLAMNPDQLNPKERCAATSNRNFEGRQGRGGRTHLMSPAMAAAAAITGHLTDVRNLI